MGRGAQTVTETERPIAVSHRAKEPSVTPWTPSELSKYADSVLDAAGVKPGDIVACNVLYRSQLWMADALADAARFRDAGFEALCSPAVFQTPNKISQLVSEDAVFIDLTSFSADPADRLAGPSQSDWKSYNQAQQENSLRWNVAVCPVPAWAQKVYPELAVDEAYRQLGQDLLSFMRQQDHQQRWGEHITQLQQRADKITSMNLRSVTLSGEGTQLTVPVLEGARFMPTQWQTKTGDKVCVNSPTEEIFTTPDPQRVEGFFTASRPVVIDGRVLTGVKGVIRSGELVELETDDAADTRFLQTVMRVRGMNRLGELGLVDQSGPIAQSGKTYFNNIIDENAGTHLGFGRSYSVALKEGHTGSSSGNDSIGHQDIIIGHENMNVIGNDQDGREIPLIRDGLWQV